MGPADAREMSAARERIVEVNFMVRMVRMVRMR